MLFHCDDNNFKENVLDKNETVLVDFYADWCGPCKMLAPIIEEIAEEYEVCKINVDEASGIARKYNIQSIPTLMVFKNGQMENFHIGYAQKEEILKLLDV